MLRFKTINLFTLGVVVILLIVNYFVSFSPVYYLIPGLLWLIVTLLGSINIRWNYHLISRNHNKAVSENIVSITFDDGPNPEFTPMILDLLSKYNAKASFFCIGDRVNNYPELFQRIIREGHTVGNHTHSHSNWFGFYSAERVISELRKTNAVIQDKSGLQAKMYRPAFGVTNPHIKKAIKAIDLNSIGWNRRSFDTTRLSEKKIVNRITKGLLKGDIILLHDSSLKTVKVLEQLLLFLQSKHLQSVTVDQLLDIEPYA